MKKDLQKRSIYTQKRRIYMGKETYTTANPECIRDPIKRNKLNNEFASPDFLKIAE